MFKKSEFQKQLCELLQMKIINGKVLLQDCKLIDENSRRSPAYSDPMYAPFYYHMGKLVLPKNFLSMSFSLGLLEKCFFASCKSVDNVLLVRQNESGIYYSPRMGIQNIRKSYKGKMDFIEGDSRDELVSKRLKCEKWDFVLINQECGYDDALYMLEESWACMSDNGIVVMENVNDIKSVKQAFHGFADSVRKEPIIFDTRYGSGVLLKGVL